MKGGMLKRILCAASLFFGIRSPTDKVRKSAAALKRDVGHLVREPSEPDIICQDDDDEDGWLIVTIKKPATESVARWERVGHLVQKTIEPDVIFYDDDPSGLRWIMPCGHVMSQDGIKEHSEREIKHGKVGICCPECSTEWDSSLIRALADMTTEEEAEFEASLADNYLAKGKPIKQCPGCLTVCEREDSNNPRVICRVCTKKSSQRYEFCWHCLGKWNTGNTTYCGNSNCNGEDPVLEKLRACSFKEFLGRSGEHFPSMRACPECHFLIEHISGCKQMVCEKCHTKFCFICLKKAVGETYQCGGYNSSCEAAPIQTDLFQ